MERVLTDYAFTSSRLITFLATLFSRLDLGRNNFAWNAVRLCVRDGFYVRHPDPVSDSTGRVSQIVCFACNSVAYGSTNEFAHAVYNAFHDASLSATDRELGLVSINSEMYRLPHADGCDRAARSRDNVSAYTDLLYMRRMFAFAYASNSGGTGADGYQCRVCFARNTDVAAVPCGHVYACFECVVSHLRAAEGGAPVPCFVCRTPVRAIQQLYFA